MAAVPGTPPWTLLSISGLIESLQLKASLPEGGVNQQLTVIPNNPPADWLVHFDDKTLTPGPGHH
jgi:hypothetical protein